MFSSSKAEASTRASSLPRGSPAAFAFGGRLAAAAVVESPRELRLRMHAQVAAAWKWSCRVEAGARRVAGGSRVGSLRARCCWRVLTSARLDVGEAARFGVTFAETASSAAKEMWRSAPVVRSVFTASVCNRKDCWFLAKFLISTRGSVPSVWRRQKMTKLQTTTSAFSAERCEAIPAAVAQGGAAAGVQCCTVR